MKFTLDEVKLLVEALNARVSRLQSMARYYPRNAKGHREHAQAMLDLKNRILRERPAY